MRRYLPAPLMIVGAAFGAIILGLSVPRPVMLQADAPAPYQHLATGSYSGSSYQFVETGPVEMVPDFQWNQRQAPTVPDYAHQAFDDAHSDFSLQPEAFVLVEPVRPTRGTRAENPSLTRTRPQPASDATKAVDDRAPGENDVSIAPETPSDL